ncbi:MAG: DUF934 domain-containing protein [Pseudomonas sp.]|nr:DUF934 domain-containing protein [Pseudomonas sp.]
MNNLIKLTAGQARIITDDAWTLLRDSVGEWPAGPLILPLALWREWAPAPVLAGQQPSLHGVCLAPDDEPQTLQPWLGVLPLIALEFPGFADGRGYSQAYALRSRLGWRGELRAVGDVLRDQLSHMRHCGFDAFAVRADKSVEDALKGLAGISVQYAPSVLEPLPLFRRRG